MEWSDAIRKLRRRAGLKQQALAELLGCDQTTVSHWERGVDRPSLAFQRRLLEMIAQDQRNIDDLRIFASVDRSVCNQVLFDTDLRILAASDCFWEGVAYLGEERTAEVFREFGRDENKRLAREILATADDTVLFEAEITTQPRGSNVATRMRAVGAPFMLSDGSIVLRVELRPTTGDVDAPLKWRIVKAADVEFE
jgi:transcriptional regulator with XRE-family HTH domain